MGDSTTRQILLTTGFKGGKKLIREDESKAMSRLECSWQKGEIPVKMHFIVGEVGGVAGISDPCAGAEASQLEICICSDAFCSGPKNVSQAQLGW